MKLSILRPLVCLALILASGSSCSAEQGLPRLVSEEEYADRLLCWGGLGDRVSGFLVIGRNSAGAYFPMPVSARCYTKYDMSLTYMNMMMIDGDGGLLREMGILDDVLGPNHITHQLFGEDENVQVFAFSGSLRPYRVDGSEIDFHRITSIDYIVDTKADFQEFKKMGPKDRWTLFEAITPP
ncbi:MAG TPA: hypothetical protein PKD48_10080 [Sphingopyxis sp.]|nr:hypothetical protein [Sphingopyxis sp.]